MLSLVAFSAASLLDTERAGFDGVIRFDSLQQSNTVPGLPAAPSSSVAAMVTLTVCVVDCSKNAAAIDTAIETAAGGGSATVTCGGSCTTRRSLLQAAGNTATIQFVGTAAQAQLLQSNIAAGNLVAVGIPSTTVVTATTPAGVAIPLTPLAPIPLNPLNPSPLNPASQCLLTTSNTMLPCQTGVTVAQCQARFLTATAAGFPVFCCPCNGGAGVQPRSSASLANVCRFGANWTGCGKHSKKGLLGLLGLLGLIPLLLCLLICCLCLLRRKRRGQAMLFSQTAVPAPLPAPLPVMHAHPAPLPHVHAHSHAGPDFHAHP